MTVRSLITKAALLLSFTIALPSYSATFNINEMNDGDLTNATLNNSHVTLNAGDMLNVRGAVRRATDPFDFTVTAGNVADFDLMSYTPTDPSSTRIMGVTIRDGLNSPGGTILHSFTFDTTDTLSGALSLVQLMAGDYTVVIAGLGGSGKGDYFFKTTASAVPLPAAFWLFGSAFMGMLGLRRSKQA